MSLKVGNKTTVQRSGTSQDSKTNLFQIKDETDPTKKVTFDLSSITTSTERTVTLPDRDVTVGELSTDPSPSISADLDGSGNYLVDVQNFSDSIFGSKTKYFFDGSDDAVVVSDDSDIDITTGDFFIVVAFKPNDVTRNTDYLINKEGSGVGYGLYLDEDDLYIRLDDGTTDVSAIIGTDVISNNTHTIVVVSFDRSGNATAYVNGISVGTVDISTASLTLTNAGDLHIGNDSAGTNEFYGEIGFCAVGNRVLTTSEVKKITNNLSFPYLYTGASQTELMPNQVDRDFSGASAWANVDFSAYDETTDLTVTADATGQYATLEVASAPTTVGKRYIMTFTVANLVSSFTIQSYDGTQTIGTVTTDGAQSFEWTATTTGGYRIVAAADDSSADFDDFTLNSSGVIFNVNASSIGHNTWVDINGNNCHGAVSGALPINRSSSHSEKFIKLSVADDTSFTLPAGYVIDDIVFNASGAIGGGIDVGTTDGGAEIVNAATISGAGRVYATLVDGAAYNTTGADDTIYITDADGTGWDSETIDVYVKMSRIEL